MAPTSFVRFRRKVCSVTGEISFCGLSNLHKKLILPHSCFCDSKGEKTYLSRFPFKYRITKFDSSFDSGIPVTAVSVNSVISLGIQEGENKCSSLF